MTKHIVFLARHILLCLASSSGGGRRKGGDGEGEGEGGLILLATLNCSSDKREAPSLVSLISSCPVTDVY